MYGPAKTQKRILNGYVFIIALRPNGHTNYYVGASRLTEPDYKASNLTDLGIVKKGIGKISRYHASRIFDF